MRIYFSDSLFCYCLILFFLFALSEVCNMPEIQKKKKKRCNLFEKSSICFVFSCKMLLFKPITLHANRNEPEKATGASQLCISTVRKFSTKI